MTHKEQKPGFFAHPKNAELKIEREARIEAITKLIKCLSDEASSFLSQKDIQLLKVKSVELIMKSVHLEEFLENASNQVPKK
jgi:hypothetical protein